MYLISEALLGPPALNPLLKEQLVARSQVSWEAKTKALERPLQEHSLQQPLTSSSQLHTPDTHAGWAAVIFLDTSSPCWMYVYFSYPGPGPCPPLSPDSPTRGPRRKPGAGPLCWAGDQEAGAKHWALQHPVDSASMKGGCTYQSALPEPWQRNPRGSRAPASVA